MENPRGDEIETTASAPIAAPSENQLSNPVKNAVSAEVGSDMSGIQPAESVNNGGSREAAPPLDPTKEESSSAYEAAIQAPAPLASSNVHSTVDDISIQLPSENWSPEQHDLSRNDPINWHDNMIHDQNPPPTLNHEAEPSEDGDRPPMDTDQMSEATSAPSMELYVDSQGDADSALGDFSILSSTQSLRPSVYDFVEENGRRFHRFRKGEYHLPNDETEQDRLDLQHHLMLLTLDGKLNLAPVENLEGGLNNVLDIATGTGIWAIEFASAFPAANVLGSDLSPIQPDFVPPNCRFEVDDVEDEWLYSHKFDYIHGRALALCFRSHKTVFEHAFNALRPGGWFEVQDVALPMVALDDTVAGTALELWVSRLLAGGKALGKDFSRVPTYKKIFEELGFVDIVERHFQWPVGTWAKGQKMKVLGAWMREDMLAGIQGGSMGVMVKGLGMTIEEVERFLVDVRADIKSNNIHGYFPVHVVYGRKPL